MERYERAGRMNGYITRVETLRVKIILKSQKGARIAQLKEILPSIGTFADGRCNVRVGQDIAEHRVDINDYGSPWVELHVDVMSHCWRQSFLKMASTFQSLTFNFGRNNTPVLQATEDEFFMKDCLPAELGIEVESVQHGNLLSSGEFYSHFCRSAPGDITVQNRCTNLISVLTSRCIESPMCVDFEHDRNLFTVRIAVLDGYSGHKENGTTNGRPVVVGSMYILKVRYSSLRRILVDTLVRYKNTYVTRIYFHLNYPPEIRRFRQKNNLPRPADDRYRSYPEKDDDTRDNCSAINDSPVLCLQFTNTMNEDRLYKLLSRLHARVDFPLDFANVEQHYFPVQNYVGLPVRVIGCDYRVCAMEDGVAQSNYRPIKPHISQYWSNKLKELNSFSLEYLIAALLSRGAVVKDQLLISEEARDDFLNHILQKFEEDDTITYNVLERLINIVDEMKDVPPLIQAFDRVLNSIYDKRDILTDIYDKENDEGFQRVRKAVITPTRMLLVVPELLMGNRVLREFDESGDGALRIQFRDDDGTHLRRNTAGLFIIQTTVHNCLLRGISISDRHFVYLASSNSQMRDNGCYFFDDGRDEQTKKIREKLGRFDRTNIPKLMSRMGQCFTQSKESEIYLKRTRYNKTYDVIGGKDPHGEPFTFSDGVGKLSEDFAKKVAGDLGLGNCVPSCFQFRHRGLKGVLSVDPALRQRRVWAKENGIKDRNAKTNKINDLDVLFRPSQDKFHAPRKEIVEIVKYSSPTPVCLNRPFINILDQVSDMQGFNVHSRVTRRVHGLLDRQLIQLSETLMSEDRCRERLAEFPRRINTHYLSLARGFALTQEPFFHCLLTASARFTLQKQLAKEQIQIPANLGRSMFGVLDETGLLQYGQIFVQFTNNISLKTPSKAAAKTILKGPVLMTKNPSIVAGDVRVFEAIDLPELRHLVDVVVFPQHGPRPHTDEMAGSDLDGDEYSVIWDNQMLFDHNEEPMDFSKLSRVPDVLEEDDVVREMRRFYVEYIKQDSIGVIANAFLVNSDIYGITSDVCLSIAEKHSQSVDFPKTGQPPEPLVKQWSTGTDGKIMPPERPERWPDFMGKTHEPSYVSPRLVGQLFRRIRLVHDVLTITSASDESSEIRPDPLLEYTGWEIYENDAKLNLDAYNAHVRALLDNYGIRDEGQLFTGCFSDIRNRISDRDTDDMSQFNTNFVIEHKVTNLFTSFRRNFFLEFGDFKSFTVADDELHYKDDENRRYCNCPTVQMKRKASAYYIVCYRQAANDTKRRLLSFPWIAWDVLGAIKQENCVRQSRNILTTDPLCEQISDFITRYCNNNMDDFIRTIAYLTEGATGLHALKRYCRKYKGLDKLYYVLCKWGEQRGLFEGRLKREHLCLLLLQYGLGHIRGENLPDCVFLEQVDEILEETSNEICALDKLIGGTGKCFLRFLQYLSSRSFETMKLFNFMQPNLGYQSILMRGQWFDLHQANRLTEIEPFTIELPTDLQSHDEELRKKMIRYSGVTYLHLRRILDRRDRVVVSAVGTLEALHRLRDVLSVKPVLTTQADSRTRSEMMLRLVYERIQALP